MKTKDEVKVKKTRSPMLRYSEKLKRQVCLEYLKGGRSARSILIQFGIKFNGAIPYWLNELKLGEPVIKPVIRGMTEKRNQPVAPGIIKVEIPVSATQTTRINELERQLEDSQLQAEAYLRIIEFAERDLKLPIRKKPNTK